MQQFKAVLEPSLRKEFKYKGDWKPDLVSKLCKTADPETTARNIFETMRQLQDRYPTIPLKNLETWAIAAVHPIDRHGRTIAPEATELLAPIPNIEYNESELATAAEQLEQLRLARRAG